MLALKDALPYVPHDIYRQGIVQFLDAFLSSVPQKILATWVVLLGVRSIISAVASGSRKFKESKCVLSQLILYALIGTARSWFNINITSIVDMILYYL